MTSELIPCTVAHGQVLAALHGACFEKAWSEADFIQFLQPPVGRGFILTDDRAGEDPIGFIVLRIVADEAEILTLGVCPDYRGQGYGVRLMTGAIDCCRSIGAGILFLDVAEDNKAALNLYRKCGFNCIDRRSKYFETRLGPIDALILRRNIE
jgi:ribosomal-protein-alanine N-acetyltransferase